jgi:hypothetical protein
MVEYCWERAADALKRADAQPVFANFFVAIALAYQLLADGETNFRARCKWAPHGQLQPP